MYPSIGIMGSRNRGQYVNLPVQVATDRHRKRGGNVHSADVGVLCYEATHGVTYGNERRFLERLLSTLTS